MTTFHFLKNSWNFQKFSRYFTKKSHFRQLWVGGCCRKTSKKRASIQWQDFLRLSPRRPLVFQKPRFKFQRPEKYVGDHAYLVSLFSAATLDLIVSKQTWEPQGIEVSTWPRKGTLPSNLFLNRQGPPLSSSTNWRLKVWLLRDIQLQGTFSNTPFQGIRNQLWTI